MAKKKTNRYYDENRQVSISDTLAEKEIVIEPIEDKAALMAGPVVIEDVEAEDAVAAEKTDSTNYEVVEIVSMELYIDKKALTNVYVRNSPEKANGNIDRILNKGETITLVVNYENAVWAKTKDGKYIMKEFLG